MDGLEMLWWAARSPWRCQWKMNFRETPVRAQVLLVPLRCFPMDSQSLSPAYFLLSPNFRTVGTASIVSQGSGSLRLSCFIVTTTLTSSTGAVSPPQQQLHFVSWRLVLSEGRAVRFTPQALQHGAAFKAFLSV